MSTFPKHQHENKIENCFISWFNVTIWAELFMVDGEAPLSSVVKFQRLPLKITTKNQFSRYIKNSNSPENNNLFSDKQSPKMKTTIMSNLPKHTQKNLFSSDLIFFFFFEWDNVCFRIVLIIFQ